MKTMDEMLDKLIAATKEDKLAWDEDQSDLGLPHFVLRVDASTLITSLPYKRQYGPLPYPSIEETTEDCSTKISN